MQLTRVEQVQAGFNCVVKIDCTCSILREHTFTNEIFGHDMKSKWTIPREIFNEKMQLCNVFDANFILF